MNINEALEELAPFAEAVMALKENADQLSGIERSIGSRKAELEDLEKKKTIAEAGAKDAKAEEAKARETLAAHRKAIEDAQAERSSLLAKAKVDAQRDYDTQLVAKQSALHGIDDKIAKSRQTLSDLEKAIAAAHIRHLDIERQITQLRGKFA